MSKPDKWGHLTRTASTPNVQLGLPELQRIIYLVKTRYDFDFSHYAMSSFKRRVMRIIQLFDFKSVDALLQKIESDKVFAQNFLEEVTVNTTEMFRDPHMWRTMREVVLPELAKNQNIHIWHAGCSTGEEVYSMAILLRELNLTDRTKIYATDLNPTVLAAAQKRQFHKRSFDLFADNYRDAGGKQNFADYTIKKKGYFELDHSLGQNVTFRKFDLVGAEPFSKFDLVLCRNVLIYFDKVLQDAVCKMFYDSLFKDGYLTIGAKESLVWCSYAHRFRTVSNESKVFQIR